MKRFAAAQQIPVPLPARRGPEGGAGLRRRVHARLLRLRCLGQARLSRPPRRGPHGPAAQGRPPRSRRGDAGDRRDGNGPRAAASIRRLLHQVEGGLRHEAERKRMREPQALISTEQLAPLWDSRTSGSTTARPISSRRPPGSDDPYIAVPGRKTFEEAHIPGADFLDLQGEFSDAGHAPALHDAGDGAARGRLRPPRPRQRHPRRALQHRHHDVGDALLVDAEIAGLRRRGGARRRLRQVEGGRPADESGAPQRLSGDHVHGRARAPACSSARSAVCGRDRQAGHRDRQRARAPVPQGARAQPLRPARARPRQRQRPGRDPGRPSRPRVSPRSPTPQKKLAAQGVTRTSTSSAIAAAASPPPSTSSCCTSSATTSSRSTTAPWASGPRTNRSPSKPIDARSRRAAEAARDPRARSSSPRRYRPLPLSRAGQASHRLYSSLSSRRSMSG